MRLAITLMMSAALLAGCSGDDTPAASSNNSSAMTTPAFPSSAKLTVKDMVEMAEIPIVSGLDSDLAFDEVKEAMTEHLDFKSIDLDEDKQRIVMRGVEIENMSVTQAIMTGVTLIDDTPYFDEIMFEGIVIEGGDYDPDVTIDEVFINPPAHADFEKMIESVDIDDLMRDDLAFDAKPFVSIGSGYLKNLKMADEEGDLTLDFIGWSEDSDAGHISFLMKGVDFTFQSYDMDFELAMIADTISLKNLDRAVIESSFTGNPFHYNMFAPYMDSVNIEGLSLTADGFYIANDHYGTWFTAPDNGVSYGYYTTNPLLIGFNQEPTSEEFREFKDAFDKLGYDRIEIHQEGHMVYDLKNDIMRSENAKMVIKDGMDFDFDFHIEGGIESFEKLKGVFEQMGSVVEGTREFDLALKADFKEALAPLDIQKYDIAMTDNSLLDRIYKVAAEGQGVDVDTIKQQASGGATLLTMLAQSPYQSELALEFSDSIGDFLEQGGTFKFALSQDKSIDVVELIWNMSDEIEFGGTSDFDPLLKVLGMSFEHIPAGTQ